MRDVGSPLERLADGALLTALGLGDADAATVFVHRFERQVFGLAVTLCHDRRLAEDIAQQTFERAWRHAGSYDARRGSVRTWVLTICRRLAIDALRLRRQDPVDPVALGALLPPVLDPDGPASAGHGDPARRMRSELARLPEPQRRAVLLAAVGGHTAAEIAEFERIPLGTAKTRLRAGLLRLREQLNSAEHADA
jgi:RNA polymerase sigma-70 factor (ECF subfamily)